ncbi:MAG: 4-(cytidine 5'-diphospho)-2-C-methyl-D-erythritol kinase [Oscillospiraceae bacterium]|nr:4-(cytidine 5'-diphospho)-2-C-methyl-D-erythritol kinase [Oscillospiraceae bacterium]
MSAITLKANAKLNLMLDICGQREDGYHNISTVMQEIDLCDTVRVALTDAPDIVVTCDNAAIPTDNRNIAFRAAQSFLRESGFAQGVNIHITKQIPLMAGLGGSSTNGAAVLTGLNRLCDNRYEVSELCEIGVTLGADVPFALVGGRALCEGVGDIITPLADLPPQFYAIVQPSFHCDTSRAYALYDENPVSRGKYANIFQKLYADERIDALCQRMCDCGASFASMTGSGSAVFGVFAEETAAQSALQAFDLPFRACTNNLSVVNLE